MKILINESQLEKLIDKFISKEMKDVTRDDDKRDDIFMYKKDGRSLGWYNKRDIVVDEEIIRTIGNVFNISYREAGVHLIKWVQEHWKIRVNVCHTIPSDEG